MEIQGNYKKTTAVFYNILPLGVEIYKYGQKRYFRKVKLLGHKFSDSMKYDYLDKVTEI